MSRESQTDILLIYPQLGSQDTLLRDIPLSLLYAATHSVKHGYKVRILDCRLDPAHWRRNLDRILQEGCRLVGLSVMTGRPIETALRISRHVKAKFGLPVVWGGPHPTILPEQTLENPNIDYVIRDWGSEPLYHLISALQGQGHTLEEVTGLGYKKEGRIILNEPTCSYEMLDYRDIPYHLVDIDADKYNRLQGEELIFPIYTAMGCPYKCAFCMSPYVYKKIKGKKWVPYPVQDILDHVVYLKERYPFSRLQIYDDDSFVNLDRMRRFFELFIQRGLNRELKIDFRGARIDELDRMDEEDLKLMVEAKVEMLAIGVESGSDATLRRMNKGITAAQIRRVSKKLARFPSLRPHYNILCGTPGETYEDLLQTKEIMIQLARDNPSCFIGAAADWKPYPGTRMTEEAAENYGLVLPQTLEGWAAIDSLDTHGKIVHPWYTKEFDNYIKLLQIAGQLLDGKIEYFDQAVRPRHNPLRLFILLAKLYRPFLKLRLKYNLSGFLVEHRLRTLVMKFAGKLNRGRLKQQLPG